MPKDDMSINFPRFGILDIDMVILAFENNTEKPDEQKQGDNGGCPPSRRLYQRLSNHHESNSFFNNIPIKPSASYKKKVVKKTVKYLIGKKPSLSTKSKKTVTNTIATAVFNPTFISLFIQAPTKSEGRQKLGLLHYKRL
ncbi:hypothetical protein ACLUEY_05865 [Vreelandella aquamarina]